jgi:hypothetical protein
VYNGNNNLKGVVIMTIIKIVVWTLWGIVLTAEIIGSIALKRAMNKMVENQLAMLIKEKELERRVNHD